jgi:hypothetical protein
LRLYLVLAVPWAVWFGYAAYEAHTVYVFNRDYVDAVDRTPGTDRRDYGLRTILREEFQGKRNSALVWLPVIPVGLPIMLIVAAWVYAGFRRQ